MIFRGQMWQVDIAAAQHLLSPFSSPFDEVNFLNDYRLRPWSQNIMRSRAWDHEATWSCICHKVMSSLVRKSWSIRLCDHNLPDVIPDDRRLYRTAVRILICLLGVCYSSLKKTTLGVGVLQAKYSLSKGTMTRNNFSSVLSLCVLIVPILVGQGKVNNLWSTKIN
jgi:hypothetical protein